MTRASVTAMSTGVMVAMLLRDRTEAGDGKWRNPEIGRQMRQRLPADGEDEEGNEGLPRESSGPGQTPILSSLYRRASLMAHR